MYKIQKQLFIFSKTLTQCLGKDEKFHPIMLSLLYSQICSNSWKWGWEGSRGEVFFSFFLALGWSPFEKIRSLFSILYQLRRKRTEGDEEIVEIVGSRMCIKTAKNPNPFQGQWYNILFWCQYSYILFTCNLFTHFPTFNRGPNHSNKSKRISYCFKKKKKLIKEDFF